MGWRLIADGPGIGLYNMAVDEALLRSAEDGGVPTVRFYRWSEPTISMGYNQSLETFHNLDLNLPIVRRLTGGRAVLHQAELTYSVTSPSGEPPFGSTIEGVYKVISETIVKGLRALGVGAEVLKGRSLSRRREESGRGGGGEPACFFSPSRYEVLYKGKKLVGSAQRRRKGAFLQHGSILLGVDEELTERVFGPGVADRMAALGDIDIGETERAIAGSMADLFGGPPARCGLSDEELKTVESILSEDNTLSGAPCL